MSNSHPCPCCGHRVLGAMPGSYEICPVVAPAWIDRADLYPER
ncbi:CPCC family cysteine-rich protein [Streptomyces sp. NPDC001890]